MLILCGIACVTFGLAFESGWFGRALAGPACFLRRVAMNLSELAAAAQKQQALTGKADAAVSLVVPGSWPAKGKRKRLLVRRGPFGTCVAELEDSVVCLFKANEIMEFITREMD